MTSRHERARATKKIGKAVTSPAGSGLVPSDASRLLSLVADALNACETSGLTVKLAHGAVITEAGYVFGVGPDDAPWAVRTRLLTEFPVPPGDD